MDEGPVAAIEDTARVGAKVQRPDQLQRQDLRQVDLLRFTVGRVEAALRSQEHGELRPTLPQPRHRGLEGSDRAGEERRMERVAAGQTGDGDAGAGEATELVIAPGHHRLLGMVDHGDLDPLA